MSCPKPMLVSILFALAGLVVGVLGTSAFWIQKTKNFDFLLTQSQATSCVHELTLLRESKLESAILSKEIQLDNHIKTLNSFAKQNNEKGRLSQSTLDQIGNYRIKYTLRVEPSTSPKK